MLDFKMHEESWRNELPESFWIKTIYDVGANRLKAALQEHGHNVVRHGDTGGHGFAVVEDVPGAQIYVSTNGHYHSMA